MKCHISLMKVFKIAWIHAHLFFGDASKNEFATKLEQEGLSFVCK